MAGNGEQAPFRGDSGGGQTETVAALMSEDAVLDEMRAILKSEPKRAEQLGRAYQERFPDGARRDEADALLVYAIYNQRRIDRARDEAMSYFRRHPDGQYTEKIAELTRLRPNRKH